VVGTVEPAGLLIFDLHTNVEPIWIEWPDAFTPLDLAPANDGGVWVLDQGRSPRYWWLDHTFRPGPQAVPVESPVTKGDFRPIDYHGKGLKNALLGRVNPAESGYPLSNVVPLGIEGLPDGTVLILGASQDGGPAHVVRYRSGEPIGQHDLIIPPLFLTSEQAALDGYPLQAYDFAFKPVERTADGAVRGTLYVLTNQDHQAFAFSLVADAETFSLVIQPRYLPMPRLGGKALVVTQDGTYYDYRDRWIPLIDRPLPRYERQGTLLLDTFDGKEPDAVWHRVLIDGIVPAGGAIRLESRANDDLDVLETLAWQAEPLPYLRPDGSELPYMAPFTEVEATRAGTGTWELLLQGAKGRYLQLRLTLTGTTRNTPHVRSLRVYYPRFSYLAQYLPAIYREDEVSASFMDRFLANPEGILTALEDKIAQAQILFDPGSTPAEYLPWLAEWIGLSLDDTWDVPRRRLFLTHATQLFQIRGTVPGMVQAIRLATDYAPSEALFDEDVTPYIYQQSSGTDPYTTNQTFRIVEGFQLRPSRPRSDDELPNPAEFDRQDPLQQQAYRSFLAQRYRHIKTFNDSYKLTGDQAITSFYTILLPESIPLSEPARGDWQHFGAIFFPFSRHAHRFTVSIPRGIDPSGQLWGLDPGLVERVVRLEKPSHTVAEIRPYWAMWQVGEARLGIDMRLELNSRLMRGAVNRSALK
jgi:phage tail-like protein